MDSLSAPPPRAPARLGALSLAALGIVYGDIGTSPLYALQAVFANTLHPVPVETATVLGVLSLVFWSLALVVSLKYVLLILRADNHGEGGIMALIALVQRQLGERPMARPLILLGMLGAALFYGDGIITPAISVLSAMEGLKVLEPSLADWVVPAALAVLCGLFAVQRLGTARVGGWFGPIMALWFLTLGALGVQGIASNPTVLTAVSPTYAVGFFCAHPGIAFFSLAGVVLAVTGVEALYADMGHLGRGPIRLAWFLLVLPSLTMNYFGQGAVLLGHPDATDNPFYRLAPGWSLVPLLALATVATVIASQAVISGAFSLTHQAIQLGYLPRMTVRHTSSEQRGQIYVPLINWTLFLAVVGLVLGFGSAGALASAYGIAVTGTMSITTILVFQVARQRWQWGPFRTLLVVGLLLAIDLSFFIANLSKLGAGGWLPLAVAALLFTLMDTWRQGRALLLDHLRQESVPLADFIPRIESEGVPSVPGCAVYLTAHPDQTPRALIHTLKHFRCLHERVVILHVAVSNEPFVPLQRRLRVEPLVPRFQRLRLSLGFLDRPSIADAMNGWRDQGIAWGPAGTTFILGRETLLVNRAAPMSLWRQRLFISLARNASSRSAYFDLPPNRVIELGVQLSL